MSSGKPKPVDNMPFFVPCQTDVANKQLVSPLSWKNILGETALGSHIYW